MDNFSHSEILSQAIRRSWIKSHKIKKGIQRPVRLKEGRGKVAIFLSVSELWSWFWNIIMCFSVILNFPCILFRLCYEDKREAETLRQIPSIVLDVKTVDSKPHAIVLVPFPLHLLWTKSLDMECSAGTQPLLVKIQQVSSVFEPFFPLTYHFCWNSVLFELI